MNLAVDRSVLPALDQIRARVAPTVLAGEQTLPVAAELAELFLERALVRGRTLACTGPAATSAAMAVVAAPVIAGSWLAVVDVPTFGLDAASEAGIPLERVVAIATDSEMVTAGWVEVMAAAVDGFDIVVSHLPRTTSATSASSVTDAMLRKLSTRIRQRGAVVVLIDDASVVAGSNGTGSNSARSNSSASNSAGWSCDGLVETTGISWSGLGSGYGHLRQRSIDLAASGRRLPGLRQCRLGPRRGDHDGVHDDVA